jgi:hypothetical protein
MTTDADLVFLPWLQRGGAAALTSPDTLDAAQPGVASAQVTVRVNDSRDVPMTVSVAGPGHVTGLQTGQVIRTDPTRGSRTFEANYLALVELDEPALPWLFTPSAATTEGRLRPWLCLVVVRKQEGVRLDAPRGGSLPVLRIDAPAVPADELPDLADSWAWAHAQVATEDGATASDVQDLLAGDPTRSLSRLVCGRVLRPQTDYLACVVPTFELGRLAGLGEPLDAETERLAPAWTLTPAPRSVELPVYYHWEFATGEGGDFQSLAMLLRARPLPESVGRRPFDVSHSGVDVAMPPPTTLELGGALRPVDPPGPRWQDPDLRDRFRTALADLLNLPLTVSADTPVLAPPRYGAVQAGLAGAEATREDRWFEQLNLEPALRVAAQFGTRVVQDQQEALMASAWEQAADLRAAARITRRAQLGYVVARSLHQRHLAVMDPGTGLQVIAPAKDRITRGPLAQRPDTGLVALLATTGLTSSAYSTALRRVARPQGALNRRLQRTAATGAPPVARTRFVLRSLQPVSLTARRLPAPRTGPVTIEAVAASLGQSPSQFLWSEGSAAGVRSMLPRPAFALEPFDWPVRPRPPLTPFPRHTFPVAPILGSPAPRVSLAPRLPDGPDPRVPLPPEPPAPPDPTPPFPHPHPHPFPFPLRDSADARTFRAVASAHLDRFYPRDPKPPRIPGPSGDLQVVFAEALVVTEPRRIFAASVKALIDVRRPGSGPPDDEAVLGPPSLAPVFPQPMATSLAELGQDLLLPGLGDVPPNTVVPLATNTPFVEAYLVGLNTELGRELLWREFPAPAKSMYFTRFWDTAIDPGAPPDIAPLDTWGDRSLGETGSNRERFVMLLRSELLRRYPHAIVYATRPGSTPPEDDLPVFSGAMEPDVRFFGFDLDPDEISQRSLVIQEQPSAPRFGIEVDDDPGTGTHLAAPDATSAALARRLRQLPVRITIPASVLLREED